MRPHLVRWRRLRCLGAQRELEVRPRSAHTRKNVSGIIESFSSLKFVCESKSGGKTRGIRVDIDV
jgi:hypothetical protein